jgi:hypothetical protein
MGFMILLLFCLFGSALWIVDQLIDELALRRYDKRRKDAPRAT